jgi:hypothetical protein
MNVSKRDKALTWWEIDAAWKRFWSKNKFAVDENGNVYRSDEPRQMPKGLNDTSWLDFRNPKKKGKNDELK